MTDKQLRNTIEELERQNAALLVANRELVSKEQQIYDTFAESNKTRTLLKNVLDNISEGFVALDKQWIITYLNPKGSLLLDGLLPEQLIGQHALTAFPKGLNQAFLSLCQKVMKERIPASSVDYYEPWGKYFENRIYPDPNGGITIFYRDITWQKQPDDVIKSSQADMVKILDNTEEIFLIIDKDFNLITQNKASEKKAESLLGLKIHKGHSILQLAAPEKIEEIKNLFSKVLKGQKVLYEYGTQNLDGSTSAFSISIAPIYAEGEEVQEIILSARDITVEQDFKKALQKSELRFRSLIEKGSEVIALHDQQGSIRYMSPSIKSVLGYLPEDRIGRSAFEAIHKDDAPGLKMKLATLVDSPGSSTQAQWRHWHANGSWRWMEGVATNLLDDPAVNAIVHNFRDITDQKATAKKSLQEKELSEFIINSLPGIFYLYDEQGRFIRWNRNFETISGYSAEEIANMHPLDFFDADEKQLLAVKIREVFKSGIADVEAHFLTKDGKKIPYFFNGRAIVFEGNTCLIGTGTDISAQKNALDDIKDSEEKRRLIMNAALDAIICIDKKGSITFWNPQAEKIFGWSGEEVMGKLLSEIIIPETYRQMHDNGIADYLKTGKGSAINTLRELSALNRQGEIFPIELTVLPIKQGGEEFFCAFIRDIAKRKTAEDAIRLSKERYDIVTKATNDSIWDWDLVTNETVRDSKKLETIFGYEGWEGTDVDYFWNKFAHPADWENVTKKRNAILEDPTQNYWEDEYRFLKTNGEYAYVYDRGYILRNADGKAIRIIGASQDISQKKIAEEKIKQERNLLRTVIDNAPDAIYVKDIEGRTLLSNQVDLTMIGVSKEAEVLGKTDMELFPGNRGMMGYEVDMNVIRTGEPYLRQEREIFTKDKQSVWLLTTKVALRNDAGEIIGLVGISTDITHLKKVQAELVLSEEKYRLLFYLSPVPKLIFDLDTGRILDVNNSAITQYEYSLAEFANLILKDIQPGANMAQMIGKAKERWQSQNILRLGVWDHITKNGQELKIDMTAHGLPYNGKECLMIACNDITENILFQQNLLESNERFTYVTNATSDAIWDWDIINQFVYRSEAYHTLFGYSTEDLQLPEYAWSKLIHPDDNAEVQDSILNAAHNTDATNWTSEYRYLKANGEYAYVHDKAIIVRNEKGKALRMIGAMQDVSARKKGEEHLKLLQSVITNTTDSILITDAEPINGDGPRIIYVNDSFTKMTGYSSEEIIGKTPRILQGPKTDRKELDRLRVALEQWQPCKIEVVNYKKNGEEFWINISVSPVANENGWFTHWISIERDVTARKAVDLQKALLAEISQLFTTPGSLNSILQQTIRKIALFSDFSLVETWLLSTDKNVMSRTTFYSVSDEMKVFYTDGNIPNLKRGQGLVGTAWETKKVQYWEDLGKKKEFLRKEAAKKAGVKSVLGLPLLYNNEVIGVLVFALTTEEAIQPTFFALFESLTTYLGAEIKRKQLEDELNQIFTLAPDIIAIAGMDGYFKKINPAASELLEYTVEELTAVPYEAFLHSDDREVNVGEAQKFGKGISTEYFENRYFTKSGKIKWLAWTCNPLPEDELIFAVAKDITEKKELESLLGKTNKMALLGSWEFDVIKDSFYWSDVTREIHEVGPDFELDSKKSIGFYKKGKNQDVIRQRVKDAIEQGIPWDEELQIVTGDNKEKWIRVIGETEFAAGKCIRVYGSFQDIDVRKKAELAVTEVLEEKNTILESIGDAFFAVDNHWTVTYWNHQAEKMLKVPKDLIIGHNLWGVFTNMANSISHKKYQQAIDTRQVVNFEDYYEPMDAWYEVSAYPSDNGLSVYFKDITERKKTDEEVKQKSSELKKLSSYLQNVREEERKYMAREVHDELGQLASALKIDIDWLGIKIQPLEENAKSRIAHANKTIEILISSIRKIASSLRPSILDDFGLNAALKWHCTEFQNLNGIPCTFEPGFDDKHLSMNQKTEFYRMTQESLTNVMRHAKASNVVISTKEDTNNLYLSITDNGRGFDLGQRKNTLGLLGLRERALSLNGELRIESIIGEGTIVTAVIPKK